MSSDPTTVLSLTEHQKQVFPSKNIPKAVAEAIDMRFRRHVAISRSVSGGTWELTPGGCVGYIPVAKDFALSVHPKVPLSNLFRMLDVAYSADLHFFDGVMHCESLLEFYDRLASVLAKRVLARAQKGFHRSYIDLEERLAYVRGRIDLRRCLKPSTSVGLHCEFQEHTGDIDDNAILLWTLMRIARSGLCSNESLGTVRKAFRSLQGVASLKPFSADACVKRLYNRLNQDYHPMHAMCRFFLEHTGPTVDLGDKTMLPFLIDMPNLYELFVARWLKANLPPSHRIKAQEHVDVSDGMLHCKIDLVLYECATGRAVCTLDTKYKSHGLPDNADVYQVAAYAALKACNTGILVYPTHAIKPFCGRIGDGVTVRSLSFDLSGDLDEAGQRFVDALLAIVDKASQVAEPVPL